MKERKRGSGSRVTTALALPLFLIPAAQADCISVIQSGYEAGDVDMGVAAVEWHAELANECAAGYDADIEIAFVDERGETVYKVSELALVPRHGSTAARRQVYIPAPDFERVQDLRVRILAERERPF